jgi:hypothetical protein
VDAVGVAAEREDFMAVVDPMEDAQEAIMAELMVVITEVITAGITAAIMALPVMGEDPTAMFLS